jgi:threonyl-tRNA synthetase
MSEAAAPTLQVTLPDGRALELPRGATGADVAERIGPRLARAAVAVVVDGEVRDLRRPIERDASVRILTERDIEALGVLRHSAAHLLATAVRELHPAAGIGFGPAIDDGFYYDFQVERPFTPEDLEALEARMAEIARREDPYERRVVDRGEARELFRDDPLKLERLEELGDDETITVYRNEPFLDLCRGPHLPHTGWVRHFRLLSSAGAYWRGDSSRPMLQRIYGTAFFDRGELDEHLHRLEEARRRDHRRLGRELDLFFFHPVAPGAAFWTERGTTIYRLLGDWMREALGTEGYDEIRTPLLYGRQLWELSGHWDKYQDNMFLVMNNETGEHDMSLKPMNCPSHHLMYASRSHSYRELPIRYATMHDVLHRNELSGALSGLTRVRQFQQDDAHIYLREEQVDDEVRALVRLIDGFYGTLGLRYETKFGTRPEERIGSDEMWDRAERVLLAAADAAGLAVETNPGDGAFYGPKLDFHVEDSIGRTWQLGTIQLDYASAERFDLAFTGDDNRPHRPVIIHRAIFGSFERFIAILIEHFAGAFPLWLAPVQVAVLPISDEQAEAARGVAARLRQAGVRVEVDDRNETLNYRIREAEKQKVPFMAVVGRREAEQGTVSVRERGATGRKDEVMPVDAFAGRLADAIAARS